MIKTEKEQEHRKREWEWSEIMEYRSQEVMDQIMRMEYFLPEQNELTALLRARKFAPVQVVTQKFADFVTGSFEEYLRFLRVSNVRAVMFSYAYYTEKELNDLFRLEDGDKALFVRRENRDRYESYAVRMRRERTKTVADSDYADYLKYSQFVRSSVDLTHPKELRLYALHQGRIIACQQADAWLERLDLLNGSRLRQYAMEQNLGAGCLPFVFW